MRLGFLFDVPDSYASAYAIGWIWALIIGLPFGFFIVYMAHRPPAACEKIKENIVLHGKTSEWAHDVCHISDSEYLALQQRFKEPTK